MNVTLSLDDKLVKEVRRIAVEQDTTLSGLVRAYLEQLAERILQDRRGYQRRGAPVSPQVKDW